MLDSSALKQATTLRELTQGLVPAPLSSHEELDAFYCDLREDRGGKRLDQLAFGLETSHSKNFYKAFLTGHQGVGKSTEVNRVLQRIADRYNPIRIDAVESLDTRNFQPFDVLLVMMSKLVEETAKDVEKGGAGGPPPDQLLKAIWDWFQTEKVTTKVANGTEGVGSAGIGTSSESIFAKFTGFFAKMTGQIRFAAAREKEVVEYRLRHIDDLVGLLNNLLDDCQERLRTATDGRKEWIFVGESFDQLRVKFELSEALFINYGSIFENLRCHFIFNFPIELMFGSSATNLPRLSNPPIVIPDIPVFTADHRPHSSGRKAVETLITKRVSPTLFERGQLTRLIVASGGNLRELFTMTVSAAVGAMVAQPPRTTIGKRDVTKAINEQRNDYEDRLGEGPLDRVVVKYPEKAELLRRIYDGEADANIRNPVLMSLLRARAVQEFNGERWFGVHPLVVDILASQKKLIPPEGKRAVPGGTR